MESRKTVPRTTLPAEQELREIEEEMRARSHEIEVELALRDRQRLRGKYPALRLDHRLEGLETLLPPDMTHSDRKEMITAVLARRQEERTRASEARAARVNADRKERSIVLEDLEAARGDSGTGGASNWVTVTDLERAVGDGQRKVEQLRRAHRLASGHAAEERGPGAYSLDRVPLYWAMRELALNIVETALQDYHAKAVVIFHQGRTADELDRMVARQLRREGGSSAQDEQALAFYRSLVFDTCKEAIVSIHTELTTTHTMCSAANAALYTVTAGSAEGDLETARQVHRTMRAYRSSDASPVRQMIWTRQETAKVSRAKLKAADPWDLTMIRVKSAPQSVAARPRLRSQSSRVGSFISSSELPDQPTTAGPTFSAYIEGTSKYWQQFDATVLPLPLPTSAAGLVCADCAAMWQSRSRVACGTTSGTLLVYDKSDAFDRWSLIAATAPIKDSRSSEPIVDVCVSANGRRVLAVYRGGVVRLFQLQRPGGKRKAGLPPFDLALIRTAGPRICLRPAALLDIKNDARAVRATFLPSSTLLGDQDCVLLALSDGSLVAGCLVAAESKRFPPPVGRVDTSEGRDIDFVPLQSLGQHHQSGGLLTHLPQYLGVSKSGEGVVVVSNNGRICVWENDTVEPVTTLGAVKPTWTLDIDLTLRSWHEIEQSVTQVTTVSDGRTALSEYVSSLDLDGCLQRTWIEPGKSGDERHEKYKLSQHEDSAVFATLTFSAKTNELVKCRTFAACSASTNAVKILDIQPTVDRASLLLLVLYPQHGDTRAHVTLLLQPVQKSARCDFRVDLTLTDAEYASLESRHTDCKVRSTAVLDGLKSDMAVVMLAGDMHLICLTTGTEFKLGVKSSLSNPRGFIVGRSEANNIHCLVFSSDQQRVEVLTLCDQNRRPQYAEMDALLDKSSAPRWTASVAVGLMRPKVRRPFRGLLHDGTDSVALIDWLKVLVETCVHNAMRQSESS